MIVSFSVSNFRSFLSEETFSLVASRRLAGNHDDHAIPIPDSSESVLRTTVLYGANGAGKSNLFKALRYVKSVALETREKNSGTGRERFRFAGSADEVSSFDLQFMARDKLYRFGFKVNDLRITEEWLAHVTGGRERSLYERITNNSGKVIVETHCIQAAEEKLKALATVGGPQNQSFLATAAATLDEADQGEELGGVLDWFKSSLNLLGPDTSYKPLRLRLLDDLDFAEFTNLFLKSSSTGVDHLKVLKTMVTEDELRSLLPPALVTDLLETVRNGANDAIFSFGDEMDLLMEKTSGNKLYRLAIQAAHRDPNGDMIPLDLSKESDGTRRLINLLPALHHLKTGGASYWIDEIDRSMHPILVLKFLEFFLRSCRGGSSQIIATTHESNLLNLDLLRRDEIWFAEKDDKAATRLYSMADFKVRKDLEIRKHYLQGRFGAVPFLGDLDRLIVEQGESK